MRITYDTFHNKYYVDSHGESILLEQNVFNYVKTPQSFDDNKILNEQLVVVKIDLCRIISKKLFAL
jgi:hypothetical protein